MPALDNLFFAVLPDAKAAAEIAALSARLRQVHKLGGVPTPERLLHVSLYSLGAFSSLSRSELATACGFADDVSARSFAVEFNCAMSFSHPSKRPFVLVGDRGMAGLVDLRDRLAAAIAKKTLTRAPSHKLVPHITLLRDGKDIPEHPVEPISWIVREFALVRSLTGRGVYKIVSRWPLQA